MSSARPTTDADAEFSDAGASSSFSTTRYWLRLVRRRRALLLHPPPQRLHSQPRFVRRRAAPPPRRRTGGLPQCGALGVSKGRSGILKGGRTYRWSAAADQGAARRALEQLLRIGLEGEGRGGGVERLLGPQRSSAPGTPCGRGLPGPRRASPCAPPALPRAAAAPAASPQSAASASRSARKTGAAGPSLTGNLNLTRNGRQCESLSTSVTSHA